LTDGLIEKTGERRFFAKALAARAMLRLYENRIDEAWEDLLTCHRLARLMGRDVAAVRLLHAMEIDATACGADHGLLRHARLTSEQLARMREDLERLAPLPGMADHVDVIQRIDYITTVSSLTQTDQAKTFSSMFDRFDITFTQTIEGEIASRCRSLVHRYIDWNTVFRDGNARFDQYVAAATLPVRKDRMPAIRHVEAQICRRGKWHGKWPLLAVSALFFRQQHVSEHAGYCLQHVLISDMVFFANRENAAITTFDLNKLAFALAAYRVDQGSYPEKLEALVPKYVAELPKDIFNSDADLQYRRDGDGYVLYSVGKNGRDDGGGKTGEDAWESNDIVVRMPASVKPEPSAVP
jgi:hypothetical protein